MGKMIRILIVCAAFLLPTILSAQVRFSSVASVYNENGSKVGSQYISANINNGAGTMTLGNMTLRAEVTNSTRNNTYGITAYSVALTSGNKNVYAAISKYDDGAYVIVVYYAEGKMRYEIPAQKLW